MTHNEALDFINSRRKFQKSSSHERIKALLHELGNPQNKMDFVHVVGTNGKGTVSTCLSEILVCSGYTVGLFTSPYIVKFEERIRVNGEYISENELCKITAEVKDKIFMLEQKGLYPTVFETILAIAMVHYQRKGCRIVVLEAGIGGQKDSTNVIEKALVSVFTSISLDHTDVLGDTVEKIAQEKSGIIKKDTVAVSYPTSADGDIFAGQNEKALSVIKEKCLQTQSELICPDAHDVKIIKRDAESTIFYFDGSEYETNLWGKHQVGNLITAICTAGQLKKHGYSISDKQIQSGITNLKMPGRTETVHKNPLVILDGGHNENAINSLKDSIEIYLQGKRITLVSAFMKDKDYRTSLKIIAPFCHKIILTQTDPLRGETTENLKRSIQNFKGDIFECETGKDAINKALEVTSDCDAVIVCGSFYLASEIRKFFL